MPVLALAVATVWAAGGSGASPSRHAAGKWDDRSLLAQVAPPGGGDEGGEDEGFDPADTVGTQGDEPVNPDTTQALPPSMPSPPDTIQPPPSTSPSAVDTAGAAPATTDTTGAQAPLDTLRGTFVPVTPDSVRAAARRAAAADSGVKDTLFMAKPRTPPPQAAPESKPRKGIFGIHPVAILLGLAALHYFVVKAIGD